MIQTVPLLALLLALSAFFSGAETALFSLSRYQVRRLSETGSRLDRLVVDLLKRPRDLLITLLLGNMAVNLLFFSVSVVQAEEAGPRGQALAGAVSLAAVIILGEITPKALAVNAPMRVAVLAAVPLGLLQGLTRPIRAAANGLVEWLIAPILARIPKERFIRTDELTALMGMSERTGLIDRNEHELLREVIGFGEIRCREVMTPRVDLAACDDGASRDEVLALARDRRVQEVFVYRGHIDEVYGRVSIKDVLLGPEAAVRERVRRLPIIPESRTIESLLREFRARRVSAAIVVDEYGGTEGVVTLERILEEIVGDVYDEFDTEEPPVRRLAEGRFQVDGRLSWRDWGELFHLDLGPEPARATTLAGFVTALLGRVPREGDRVAFGDLKLTVDRVRRRRIHRLKVELEDESPAEGTP
ncbi:MAG: HlyC/CorC family transporter [Planctomycetes bacterium]|nr:HlyC/CorC family transporter [Planctomycetota bacterium]